MSRRSRPIATRGCRRGAAPSCRRANPRRSTCTVMSPSTDLNRDPEAVVVPFLPLAHLRVRLRDRRSSNADRACAACRRSRRRPADPRARRRRIRDRSASSAAVKTRYCCATSSCRASARLPNSPPASADSSDRKNGQPARKRGLRISDRNRPSIAAATTSGRPGRRRLDPPAGRSYNAEGASGARRTGR